MLTCSVVNPYENIVCDIEIAVYIDFYAIRKTTQWTAPSSGCYEHTAIRQAAIRLHVKSQDFTKRESALMGIRYI